ncbi:pancreatic triacylglycerol lipase-like [Ochlerotatus camptorhynchus]|uniref:pancreatic triacylglycerol lipase-like n=1 Tax=Ochlerotatus camptorhynchus TaxID=644619 RepID=UPI0031D68773
MKYVLKLLVLGLLGNSAFAGLLNIFSASSDYNAAQLMDSLFGAIYNTTELIVNGGSSNPLSVDITFWCGNRNNPNLVQTMMNDSSLSSKISTSKPLVFIIHGWLDNRNRNWITKMTTDYLKYVDTNICVVDWGNLATYAYAIAANNTYTVGQYLAQFITFLTGNGFSLNDVTLVGHSMGAQIAGHTGYNLGGQISAIYGLDPASPLFKMPFDVGPTKRLDKSNAKYVQMIITSRCFWGVCVGDGHENFYPNGGAVPQPNCVLPLFSNAEAAAPIICSHAHATTLFREALNPSNVFKGKTCLTCIFGLFGKTSKMGIYSSRVGGDFYLLTSPFPPFTL